MSKKSILNLVEIKTPCAESWDEMRGNDTVRFCSHCVKDVHDISQMTRADAEQLIAKSGGNLCVRYTRRPDGKIKTVARKSRQIPRQAKIAASVLSATLSLAAASYAQGGISLPPLTKTVKTKSKNQKPITQTSNQTMIQKSANQTENQKPVNQASASQKPANQKPVNQTPAGQTGVSQIAFTIFDRAGAFVPRAAVRLINEDSKEKFVAASNDEGVARFDLLPAGDYEITVKMPGFAELTKKVKIAPDIVSNIDLTLDAEIQMLMGESIIITFENPLINAISANDMKLLKTLAAGGADLNAREKSYDDFTALHFAAARGHLRAVKILLEAGADPNLTDKSGETAFQKTASDEIKQLLVLYGAKSN